MPGILGPGRRFAHDAALAAYAGASPLEASSAGHLRHRLNRGGNRRLNAILYMIALSQARHSEQAKAYIARRVSEGKTRREAMRALKRYLVRAIWRLWMECYPSAAALPELAAAFGTVMARTRPPRSTTPKTAVLCVFPGVGRPGGSPRRVPPT